MASMNISLSDSQKEFIEELVARGHYKDASEYLQALVDRDLLEREQEKIDGLLIEGLDSGRSTPMTAQDWEDMRQHLRDRLASRNGS